MDPPSILPVVDIDPLVVIIHVDDMLHCEVQVSTDVWSPSENPFLFFIMLSMYSSVQHITPPKSATKYINLALTVHRT